jgi:hypothetical protein
MGNGGRIILMTEVLGLCSLANGGYICWRGFHSVGCIASALPKYDCFGTNLVSKST